MIYVVNGLVISLSYKDTLDHILVINLKCDIYVVKDLVGIGTWRDTLEHTVVIIQCDKAFIVNSSSQKHIRTHTGDKCDYVPVVKGFV